MSNPRPYVSFDECKARITIPDVLAEFAILDQYTRHGDMLAGICPLPTHPAGPNRNPDQFKVHLRDGIWLWKCFSPDCGKGGDVVELVKEMTGFSHQHVRFWFAEHFPTRLSLTKPQQRKDKARDNSRQARSSQASSQSHQILDDSLPHLKPLRFFLDVKPHRYLVGRGFTEETQARFGPMGLATKGVLKSYFAIPVFGWPRNADDNPVGYIGRLPREDGFSAQQPRYKVPTGFEVSKCVYGLAQALDATAATDALVVVEGVLKTMWLAQSGFSGAVSSFTASLSDEQADILAATGRPIVLMFDGNDAGYAGMRRAAAKLITKCFVRVVKLEPDVEPDHLSPTQLADLIPRSL